ncbi:high affinity sulfate permease [Pterulicium gracile]|uniref:High affinity sulfate permease n=1 Tax=Pterulicium gracile TaxID=1884261 RepID=A0A5C3R2L9_9AGAR|nr:high affinity sulfate permease [Pterula gracilis]
MASVKRWGKNTLAIPENAPPSITTGEYFQSFSKGFKEPIGPIRRYLISLFPIIQWLPRYNFGWLSGDLIAGLTVGLVLVPQGMSYAVIATLPPEYGLYSSFVGVTIYCLFATSKDVSIGPVAVMSLTVAQIIRHVEEKFPGQFEGPEIATILAFTCGFIVLGIGLLRLGWLVEFIPLPAVSGFMTGSAISIVAGQVPGLMGITGFDTRAPTYRVIINTLKGLPRTKLDAAWGLTGLVCLYAIRFACEYFSKRYPRKARMWFFISVLRNGFVVIVLTLAAWLYTRDKRGPDGNYPIRILKDVPRGFKHVRQPRIDADVLGAVGSQLPVATIILLLEHIAISKSFGRINGYTIDPNQELIAIGVTNTIGSVFGAYPATGSFSRSALKAKSGVRTPIAGIFTAVIIIVALYGLTDAFYWIPTGGLSAVIIHAVADLVTPPDQVFTFWRVSPLEFIIWLAAVLVTVFTNIENGIYTSVAASLVLLLLRITHPRGSLLGKVVVRDNAKGEDSERTVFVPLEKGTHNQRIQVVPPSPGIVIYRHEESYVYPNSWVFNTTLVSWAKGNTKRGQDMRNVLLSDRPWNEPCRRDGSDPNAERNASMPPLLAVVLDFSSISQIDTTSVQSLIDTRKELERWAGHSVEFHFASILSPWIHRALVAGGFGTGTYPPNHELAPIIPEYRDDSSGSVHTVTHELVATGDNKSKFKSTDPDFDTIVSQDTPFFHVDLIAAVRAAERNAMNNQV